MPWPYTGLNEQTASAMATKAPGHDAQRSRCLRLFTVLRHSEISDSGVAWRMASPMWGNASVSAKARNPSSSPGGKSLAQPDNVTSHRPFSCRSRNPPRVAGGPSLAAPIGKPPTVGGATPSGIS